MRRRVFTRRVRGIHRVHAGHAGHATGRGVPRHAAVGGVVALTAVAVWHHCARAHLVGRRWRHRVAMAASASVGSVGSVYMALEVAVGSSASVRRCEGVGACTSWREWVRIVSILVGAPTEGYQLIGHGRLSTRTALEGIVARIGHHTRRIATWGRLLRNVGPLVVRVVWRGPRPWRAIGVVVVALQLFRMVGLRPPPSRPRIVFCVVPATGPVARRFVDRRVPCRLVASALCRSRGRCGRSDCVVLHSRRT
jgi:hypothetical protein